MHIELDPRSDVAIYQQVRDRIVEAVASGGLVPEQQLASVRQVALSFGINVATVTKAYDALRREGYIRTNHKSGSVVARGPGSEPPDPAFVDAWGARATTLLAEAVAHGVPETEIVARCRSITDAFAIERARPARQEDPDAGRR